MNKIYPVLLAGGTGTRLWPVSRKSYPKQFTNVNGSRTLFQDCSIRLSMPDRKNYDPLITITNEDFRFIAAEQLKNLGLVHGKIILEAEGKNTAAAILAAAFFAIASSTFFIMVLIDALCELFKELREFACLDLFLADWIFAIGGR